MTNPAYSKYLLLILFIAGVCLAVTGSGVQSTISFNDDIITINGHGISHDEFAHAQAQNPNLSESKLLSMLVDNKLLLQRAEELGLVQSDRVIRKTIVQRVVEQEVNKVLKKQPDETDLKAFYQAQLNMFTSPKQFQVEIASFNQDDNQCNQAQAVKITWQESTTLTADWHNNLVNQPLANNLHSEALVYRQLGKQLANQLSTMQAGEISAPIHTEQGCALMLLVTKTKAVALPFTEVKEQVLAEYRVMARRKALSDLLANLRKNASIDIAKDITEVLSHD